MDGESLLWAAKRVFISRASRKIIIVLSNGQPCAEEKTGNLYGNLTKMIGIVRDAGIEVYSIGIMTDAARQFYGEENSLTLNSLGGADKAFFTRLAAILQGKAKPMTVEAA